MNRMKLDDALREAQAQLASTPVPPEDAAVARAHMLAAFARAQEARAALVQTTPASSQPQYASGLAMASAGRGDHRSGLNGDFFNGKLKWLASAALLVLAIVWLQMPVNKLANEDNLAQVSSDATLASAALTTTQNNHFLPLVDSATWATAQRGWVVPTDLPVTELAAMGLPFDASRATDTVRAELLMSETGELLGVRLVSSPDASLS